MSNAPKEVVKNSLAGLREAFERRDWAETLAMYDQLRGIKGQRSVRLEATCLAVRALVAQKDRSAARALLRSVTETEYSKPVHYVFLARAFLDLMQFKQAAKACERADELREEEAKAKAA